MKLKAEVTIDADPATVWRYFDDADKLVEWQPGLTSVTHESGVPGQPDAVRKLHFQQGRQSRVETEMVTARREPDFLAGTMDSESATAVVVNHFEKAGEDSTRWVTYWNYRFKGAARLTSLFTHKSVQERMEADMQRFKLLVETSESSS